MIGRTSVKQNKFPGTHSKLEHVFFAQLYIFGGLYPLTIHEGAIDALQVHDIRLDDAPRGHTIMGHCMLLAAGGMVGGHIHDTPVFAKEVAYLRAKPLWIGVKHRDVQTIHETVTNHLYVISK